MKKSDFIFIIFSFLLGFLAYFSSNNYFLGALIGLISLLNYFVFLRKKFSKYSQLIERVHVCYHFINSFVITLSVKDSLEDAYQNGIRVNNTKLNEETEQLKEMPVLERVKYLNDFFGLSIYKMFLNVLALYQDQGGNILSMTDNLLRECTRTEKVLSDTISISNKHLVEFLILWAMSFGILLFMKISIKEFYLQMLKNSLVVPMLGIYFLMCILSITFFVNQFTNLTVKEEKHL